MLIQVEPLVGILTFFHAKVVFHVSHVGMVAVGSSLSYIELFLLFLFIDFVIIYIKLDFV